VNWYCPVIRAQLEIVARAEAEERLGSELSSPARAGRPPVGITERVALSSGWAYPVIEDVPVLLVPERLFPDGDGPVADVSMPPYAEAYSEMDPYSAASDIEANAPSIRAEVERLERRREMVASGRASFPDPVELWIGPGDEFTAQLHALRHLAPVEDQRVLQVGGNGWHAVSMLAAGAREASVVSPVLDELRLCARVAKDAGLDDRLSLACAIAEELPIKDKTIDLVYSPASIHHTVTERSFPEIARVLAPEGRFASVDVFKSPLYDAGIKMFGKREANVYCKPLDHDRLAPASVLPGMHLSFHGSLFRYPLSVASRRGRNVKPHWFMRLTKAEDAIARVVPGVSRLSSLVCITADASRATE
jgi:SAM-dependent methyltransferase